MKSMTGYAALDGAGRRWEMRSVNGRGADLRLRLPAQPTGLEPVVRAAVAPVLRRGTATVSLRYDDERDAGPGLDEAAMRAALRAVATVEAAAQEEGVALAPPDAADVLATPGVWSSRRAVDPPPIDDLTAEARALAEAFDADRRREGAALRGVIAGHLDDVDAILARATGLADEAAAHAARALREAVTRLDAAGAGARMDEGRIAAELAAQAVRADTAEEVDRLRAHRAAAGDLLNADGPVGRRMDFLAQEMAREANTLGAKAQLPALSDAALDLKVVVDRLREQAANVE